MAASSTISDLAGISAHDLPGVGLSAGLALSLAARREAIRTGDRQLDPAGLLVSIPTAPARAFYPGP